MSLTRRPHGGGAQNRLEEGGRDSDESSAKAQTWLDQSASMWEIEGIFMEDGWCVGGRADGAEGLLGNLIADAKLGLWMPLVETFPCSPGPCMLYELVLEGGKSLIPVWEVPGWGVLSELHGLC
jgi:hypothetical protein